MFRVFPSRASSAAVYEALLDGILGFVALLAAAFTLGVVPSLAGIVSDTREMAIALGFALVMALLQSFIASPEFAARVQRMTAEPCLL